MQATAALNPTLETYQLYADIQQFPLSAYLTDMPLGPLTGHVGAAGTGFDLMSVRTQLTADAEIEKFHYDRYDLSGIKFGADLKRGIAQATFDADNSLLVAGGKLQANLNGNRYDLTLDTQIPHIDMMQLGATAKPFFLGSDISIHANTDARFTDIRIEGGARHNHFTTPQKSTMGKDIIFNFATNTDTTTTHIHAGDLAINLGAKGNLELLSAQTTQFISELSTQLENKIIDQNVLKDKLPTLAFHVEVGKRNPLYKIARLSGYDFSTGHIHFTSDPDKGLYSKGHLGSLRIGNLLLDTINTYVKQDTTGVQFFAPVEEQQEELHAARTGHEVVHPRGWRRSPCGLF